MAERKVGKSRFRRIINEIVDRCEKENIPVRFVATRHLKDYAGMNPRAAKSLGYKYPKGIPKRALLVDATSSPKRQARDLLHEEVEYKLMGEGYSYWAAHTEALKEERKIK